MKNSTVQERREMVRYKEFNDKLLAEVANRLPTEQGYEVEYSDDAKNNSAYLRIRQRNKEIAALPLMVFLKRFEEHQDLSQLAGQILETVHLLNGYPQPERLEFSYADYEMIKENLAIKLESASKAAEAEGTVYEKHPLGILSAYYRVENRNDEWQWTRVPLYMQRFYNVSSKEILSQALKNTREFSSPRLYSIMAGEERPCMCIVTTFEREHGATAFMFQDVQEELHRQIRGNYYVLPLNLHEIMAIRKSSAISEEQIRIYQKKMLENTLGKDYLGKDLFVYDSRKKRLTVCEPAGRKGKDFPDFAR